MPSVDRDSSQDPVAFTAPVPRPRHRFWRCCDRWMTLSRHPETCADLAPFGRCNSTLGISSHDALTDVHHADDRSG
jgi:hypothetical protein